MPETKLKEKYTARKPVKGTRAKGGGNSGNTGKASKRKKRGWHKHGNGPANVANNR